MNDAVAYMAWKRIVPWKVLSMMARPNQRLVPVGFGARNRDFCALLEPGSRIWVVTRVASEFSLAACVTVREKILDRDTIPPGRRPKDVAKLFVKWRFVARADTTDSEFFETNDAEPVLAQHQIRFAQNRTIAYRNASLKDSFAPCMAQARQTVFLSYRWCEGRRFAVALAREFRRRGLSPWLDALSIPDYEATREPGVTAPRLRKLIESAVDESTLAVVMNTETYARTFWTRMELNRIRGKDALWFQVMRGGRECECEEPSILSRKPAEVVQAILERRGSK
jgi:hypothetical protein